MKIIAENIKIKYEINGITTVFLLAVIFISLYKKTNFF